MSVGFKSNERVTMMISEEKNIYIHNKNKSLLLISRPRVGKDHGKQCLEKTRDSHRLRWHLWSD